MKKLLVFVLFLSLPMLASADRASTARAAKTTTASATSSNNAKAARINNTSTSSDEEVKQRVSSRISTTNSNSSGSSVRGSISRSPVAATTTSSSSSVSDCKTLYSECMDQFCNKDIQEGGRCECSDEMLTYEDILTKINDADKKAKEIATVGVEKIQLGAKSEYVFTGTKTYDDDKDSNKTNQIDMSVFNNTGVDFSSVTSGIFGNTGESASAKGVRGDELYSKSQKLCLAKISGCDDEMSMIKTLYEQSIAADCRTYKKYLTARQSASEDKLATAEKAQRAAMLDSYNDANKYNRGECMLEYKKCMADTERGGCGANFENCTDRTILENKKYLCERITDSCIAVRDYVWNDFLAEIEPVLKTAELLNENNLLYSCLGNISTCIQKACTENLSGETTLDACLGNPDMARSFCVNYITPCEKKVPEIWDYVEAKLASMRVDACSSAVKSCLTDENACGSDYSNCVGLSTDDIKKLCPTEKLVACRKDNTAQNFNNIDDIIQGIFLNLDNQQLINCQNYADESMMKVCGDTANCNTMVIDENTGSGSLSLKQRGNDYVISGLIYWNDIEIDENGDLDVDQYKKSILKDYKNVDEEVLNKTITEIGSAENFLKSIKKSIAADPKVQYCLTGRSVDGSQLKSTKGRFPNLLSQSNKIIAEQAVRLAKNNYNNKINSLLAEASAKVDTNKAEVICNNMSYDKITSYTKIKGRGSSDSMGSTTIMAGVSSSKTNKARDETRITSTRANFSITDTDTDTDTPLEFIVNGFASEIIDTSKSTAFTQSEIDNAKKEKSGVNYEETTTTTFNPNTRECTITKTVRNCKKMKAVKAKGCKTWSDPEITKEVITL